MEEVSNRPSLLVTKSFDIPVSTFSTATFTPGITAPVESVTVPRISPEFVLWARLSPLAQSSRHNKLQRIASLIYCLRKSFFQIPRIHLRFMLDVAAIQTFSSASSTGMLIDRLMNTGSNSNEYQ